MKYFILLLFSSFVFSQSVEENNLILNDSILSFKNYSLKEQDSIFKNMGIKYGDRVTVTVLFQIDENGNVVINEIKSPHEIFTKETLSLFKKLPKIDPPKKRNGKRKNVKFSQRIIFIINEEWLKEKK